MRLKASYYFNCKCSLCESEKEVPLIKYDELYHFKSILDRESELNDCHLLVIHKVIEIMQTLFYRYDERVTNVCDQALEKLVVTLQGPFGFNVNVSKVKEFAKNVEQRLRITFGTEHKAYQYFINQIATRLNRAS